MNARLLVAAMLFAPVQGAFAASIIYSGSLNGPAESPANASTGTGTTLVSYDPATHMLNVQISFTGLLGNTTASHIHCCTADPGTLTAGVATQLPTFSSFPLGVTSGTYAMTFDLTLDASWNASFITAHGNTTAGAEAFLAAGMSDGRAYLNVHSSTFPGGEIRSFLIDRVFANGFEG